MAPWGRTTCGDRGTPGDTMDLATNELKSYPINHRDDDTLNNICYMSDRQNLTWKMRSPGKVIVFGTSLYRFTVYPDCIIRIPWQTACRKPFYTSTSRLGHLWLPCAFFSSTSTVWWVWCDTCQRNCKSQLHHPFSSSETSFEFSLLGKPGWALTATCSMPFIHSPASAQQTIDLVQRLCLGYLHLG